VLFNQSSVGKKGFGKKPSHAISQGLGGDLRDRLRSFCLGKLDGRFEGGVDGWKIMKAAVKTGDHQLESKQFP